MANMACLMTKQWCYKYIYVYILYIYILHLMANDNDKKLQLVLVAKCLMYMNKWAVIRSQTWSTVHSSNTGKNLKKLNGSSVQIIPSELFYFYDKILMKWHDLLPHLTNRINWWIRWPWRNKLYTTEHTGRIIIIHNQTSAAICIYWQYNLI